MNEHVGLLGRVTPSHSGGRDTWRGRGSVRVVEVTPSYPTITQQFTPDDPIVLVRGNASNGAFTVTMPDPATTLGILFYVKKTDSGSNAVTVSFPDYTGQSDVTLSNQNDCRGIVSNGTTYDMVSSYLAITG